jgi:adenosylhomocysteine nucleosidase
MERGRIGFVTGLKAEAALLRNAGFMVGVGGGEPAGAQAAAQALVAKGAVCLVSFGLAGGLNPALPPGVVLVPPAVIEAGESFACDPDLLAWLGGATARPILAGAQIAVTMAQKSALFAASHADAIDLESGAVARVAAANNLPFAVLRAIADPASRSLPPAAMIALDAGGAIGFSRVLASVFANPRQIPALLALAKDAQAARKALLASVRKLTK